MPSDAMAIVSTGIGVGVFAGVLSGVCYVLAHGFSRKRIWNPTLQWYCAVCGHRFRSNFPGKVKTCSECEERVCKTRCSRRDHVTKEWICYNCLKRSTPLNNILGSIVQYFKSISLSRNIVSKNREPIMGKRLDDGVASEQDREYVRDFIETLVSTIIGESVDDASIFRMYNDKHYIALFSRYHQDVSGAITKLSSALQTSMKNGSSSEQNPSSAHSSLKLLIEKILSETTHLPRFRRPVISPTTPEEVTYEDLLATAVLNKIINKKETGSNWSLGNNNRDEIPSEYTAEDEAWGPKYKQLDTTSSSSFDEYVQSDSSQSSSEFVNRVSLTIHQQIEDIPSSKEQNNATDHETGRSSLISHRSNWHLQKRQFHDNSSPLPVPMLVPNPLTSAKVLIGDKEADETSDLSDANSEHEEERLISPNGNFFIDSTLTIEQKIPTYDVSDEDASFDSGVREDRDDFNEKDTFYFTEHTNISFDNDHEKVASLSSSASNVERDSEYLEQYSSLPNITYTNTSAYSYQPAISTKDKSTNISEEVLDLEDHNEGPLKDEVDELPTFEGSYTKKEKEKWKHPVKMSHNPYSEENIRKRIHKNERFGRDYYTRQASLPSGRAKTDETVEYDIVLEEEPTLYRAEPIATLNSDFETEEYTLNNNSDVDETFDLDKKGNLDVDINFQRNKFENFNVFNGPPKNEKITVRIKVNEKTPVFVSSEEFTINSNVTTDDDTKSFNIILNNEANLLDDSKKNGSTNKPVIARENLPMKNIIRTMSSEPLIREAHKDNFQTPAPTVVSKKSDNTLIRKIYSNPVVRNFALTTRDNFPGMVDENIVKPAGVQFNQNQPVKDNNFNNLNSKNVSYDVPVRRNFTLELNNAENTQDSSKYVTKDVPVRRNFNLELNNSEDVQDSGKNVAKVVPAKHNFSVELNNSKNVPGTNKYVSKDVSARHNFSLEFSDNEEEEKSTVHTDNDVNELRERRIVASRLGQFSKSFPNLTSPTLPTYDHRTNHVTSVPAKDEPLDQEAEDEPFDQETKDAEQVASFVSVKDLKKLFEKSDVINYSKDKPVHSLTARSISKEIKRLQ